jgi:hypothetical protein
MSSIMQDCAAAVNHFDICPDALDDPGCGLAWDAPENRADRASLADAIELEVARYRALNTSLGDLIGDHLVELAVLAGLTGARDPEQLRDRAECFGECHR